jgi:hypothetical protein
MVIGALLALACVAAGCATAAAAPVGGRFQVRHVFVLVLENESAAVTFGPDSPAPYLSKTLPARGAFVPNYYDEDVGVVDPSRESATQKVTGLCDSHVVNLDALPADLSRVSSTRNYTFITPNLCNDGHDATCANGQSGGLPAADAFLKTWVPRITASQAFKEDGLLLVIFDEAAGGDSSSCCGEIPGPGADEPGGTGPGGGRTGAVLLSPCIAPGTFTNTAYNHYTMLGSVENIFGRAHLGYAGLPHSTYFGSDIYKSQCGPSPPRVARVAAFFLHAPRGRAVLQWTVSTKGGTPLAYSQVQTRVPGGWRTVVAHTMRTSYSFLARVNQRYRFRVRAVNAAGQSHWSSPLVVGSVT